MKARMPAGYGRPDMNALMRQAQKMQDDMKAKNIITKCKFAFTMRMVSLRRRLR